MRIRNDMLSLVIACALLPPAVAHGGGLFVGYWNFEVDETTDSSGLGHHAQGVNGNAVRTTSTAALGVGSLALDGNGDSLQLNRGNLLLAWRATTNLNDTVYTNKNATLSLWVKLNDPTPDVGSKTGFVGLDGSAWSLEWQQNTHYPWVGEEKAYLAAFLKNATGRRTVSLSAGVNRANWHLVTITSCEASNSWKVFQNGVQVHSTTQGVFGLDGYLGWTIGQSASKGYHMDGYVDDVGLFADALSSNKVRAVYSLATTAGVLYNLGQVVTLFDLYDSAGGQASIDGTNWCYKANLTGQEGVVETVGLDFNLRLDSAGGGVSTMAESGSIVIFM